MTPNITTAAISSVVATGRRMKVPARFNGLLREGAGGEESPLLRATVAPGVRRSCRR